MASLKVKYRCDACSDSGGTIFYQITHDRKSRQIRSGYSVRPDEWDFRRATVVSRQATDKRRAHLDSIRTLIRHDIGRLTRIIKKFETDGII